MKKSVLLIVLVGLASISLPSCKENKVQFVDHSPITLNCLDSVMVLYDNPKDIDVKIQSSNTYVTLIDERSGYLDALFSGEATLYLVDSQTNTKLDSVQVNIVTPREIEPITPPLIEFGCTVDSILNYESTLGFKTEIKTQWNKNLKFKQTIIKTTRLFYGNHTDGLYYYFDEKDRLKGASVFFDFSAMNEQNSAKFSKWMISRGVPAAKLGGVIVTVLYNGEDENEYKILHETLEAGAYGNSILKDKPAIAFALSPYVASAIMYFPAQNLYDFPNYLVNN